MVHLIGRTGLRPVGVIRGRSGLVLFDERELAEAGIWPSQAFDYESERWLADYARERGLSVAHVEERLRLRLAVRLGVPSVDADELERAGIGRRVGRRWVIDWAAADDLLAEAYDAESEATAPELFEELGGYPTVSQLSGSPTSRSPESDGLSRREADQGVRSGSCASGGRRPPSALRHSPHSDDWPHRVSAAEGRPVPSRRSDYERRDPLGRRRLGARRGGHRRGRLDNR
jgi:hypothetical protein